VTSDRIRNSVVVVVLAVWVVVVVATLLQGKIPDAPLLGIPGAVYLALHPPGFTRPERQPSDPASPPVQTPPAPTTDQGGTSA
jgi:hypothetical protein